MKRLILCALVLAACGLGASDCEPSSDTLQNHQQEQLSLQSVRAVGLPAITNFQEKRNLKMILELRDSESLRTFTYVVDMNGRLHKICDSIGFGVPYATQYTSPSKYVGNGAVLPQADPNGLFSPPSADGTWVLCLNPTTKKVSPIYIEPRIIVSPFALGDT